MSVREPVAVATGTAVPEREVGPITPTDIVRFAGAGGDFNPLHHDPAFARRAGFDGVIAMGQMQAGMLASWLTDWCGVEYLRELDVRFRAPVRPGAVLRFTGEATGLGDLDGEPVAALALRAAVGEDEVVRASAVIAVNDGSRAGPVGRS
ncbi:MaoC family dehydratase N-terminal domain-containing protein [Pseudonocardia sp. RS11V-5]|uniref:MaoC/PaaZ C-terminal domain-containing protein n=1 Tax=Pseudonocardia terrae TaxID=2905831 RepID=UPI001E4C5D66|nr:MaoC/PaaZ C-terminal domain-containing protein [Pseudonocardia terrae]MCE3551163.1 MaoC family dehydratase N-terminal domain-containing protein [Pseudonocardia terrae]